MKSQSYNPYSGGKILIGYLYNAIVGKIKNTSFELVKKGTWQIHKNGKQVKHMHFKSNKAFLVGEIGIEKILIEYK